MTGQEHLLFLLSEVDSQLVEEAAQPARARPSRPPARVGWGALAACFLLAAALGGMLGQTRMGGMNGGGMDNAARPPAGNASSGGSSSPQDPGAMPGDGDAGAGIGDAPGDEPGHVSGEAPPESGEGSVSQEGTGSQDLPVLPYAGQLAAGQDIDLPGWADGGETDLPETLPVYALSQDGLQLIGDYPLLSVEEAVELLCGGSWPGFDPQIHIAPSREQIVRTELLYFTDEGGCCLPCYRFCLAPEEAGTENAAAQMWYVFPAVDGRYLECAF